MTLAKSALTLTFWSIPRAFKIVVCPLLIILKVIMLKYSKK